MTKEKLIAEYREKIALYEREIAYFKQKKSEIRHKHNDNSDAYWSDYDFQYNDLQQKIADGKMMLCIQFITDIECLD